MIKKLLIILSALLTPIICTATPTITGYANGVISGSGFGSKATAPPVYYDEFERSPLTTTATIGTWSGINGNDASATHARHGSSSYAAHKNFTGDGTLGVAAQSGVVSQKWFVSMWVYLDVDFDWGTSTYGNGSQMLSNIKYPVRFWKGSGLPNIYNSLGYGLDVGSDNNVEFAGPNPGDTNSNFASWGNTLLTKNTITKGTWHQIQQEFVDSVSGTGADCEWRVWLDGKKVYDRSNFVCNTNTTYRYPLFIGIYNAWGPPVDSQPNDAYIDDIYADTTLQRVEICDAAVRSNATHCEIQIPSSWGDREITVTEKLGSFLSTEGLYLYAVDAEGLVSAGYALSTPVPPLPLILPFTIEGKPARAPQ